MELWQALASLGRHRPVDWWSADRVAADEQHGKDRARGRHSAGVPSAVVPDIFDRVRDQNAARRAYAAGKGPKPVAETRPDPSTQLFIDRIRNGV